MASRDSLLARGLEPFVAGLWTLFILVSLGIAVVWTFGFGEGSLERTISNPDLRAVLVWMLVHSDLGWITLAAANVYLSLVATVGLATSRRWAVLILVGVIALAWFSATTGFPLGRIRYGAVLGLKAGPVPLGLPLLWFSVIVGAREALLRLFPQLSRAPLAVGVGLLAAVTDLNLEPLAAKLHGFWFWSGSSPTEPPVFDAPFSGSLAWGVLAALLALTMRGPNVAVTVEKRSWQPMATLGIFQAVFLATHVARRFWH